MATRQKTRFTGVYTRPLENGDTTIEITYRANGRLIWEKVGTSREGVTPKYASNLRYERTRSVRLGEELPRDKKARELNAGTLNAFWEAHHYPAIRNSAKDSRTPLSYYLNHVKPAFGDRLLASIKPIDVEQFKNRLLASSLAKGTVMRILLVLQSALARAVRYELIDKNPATNCATTLSPDNHRLAFFSKDQIDKLLEATAGTDKHEIIKLSLMTGMRSGEIAALRWKEVSTERGVAMVPGKNGKTEPVYLPPPIIAMLENRWERLANGPLGEHLTKPSDLVFPAELSGGRRPGMPWFTELVDKLGFNEGVEDRKHRLVFHSLRHTFASWQVMEGVPIYAVMSLMRHSSTKMTQRYSHLAPGHMKDTVSKMWEGWE